MPDTLLRMGGTVVQHGPASDRVYVLRLAPDDVPQVLDRIQELADQEGYGKLVAKARGSDLETFVSRGYRAEAVVPGFYGDDSGVFVGKFLDPDRRSDAREERVVEVLKAALGTSAKGDAALPSGKGETLDAGVRFREADAADVEALADCYQDVFESYPFPIDDPRHLAREMEHGTRFFTAWEDGALVAASSMEPGGAPRVVEMTDFATRPTHRGRGLATRLLGLMDQHARTAGVRVAYTIARAVSFGMNITFARRAYRYGGTLVNNTHISGALESMNVWYKPLVEPGRTPS